MYFLVKNIFYVVKICIFSFFKIFFRCLKVYRRFDNNLGIIFTLLKYIYHLPENFTIFFYWVLKVILETDIKLWLFRDSSPTECSIDSLQTFFPKEQILQDIFC